MKKKGRGRTRTHGPVFFQAAAWNYACACVFMCAWKKTTVKNHIVKHSTIWNKHSKKAFVLCSNNSHKQILSSLKRYVIMFFCALYFVLFCFIPTCPQKITQSRSAVFFKMRAGKILPPIYMTDPPRVLMQIVRWLINSLTLLITILLTVANYS